MPPSRLPRRLLILFTIFAATLPLPLPAQAAAPSAPPPPEGIVCLHDVVIGKGGSRDLHAEVAYPKNSATPLPAVIFIHGGGFISGSNLSAPILYLAQSGYFAASIEYRFSTEAKWPAQIQDCKLGVRWLRANAAQYHVDPDRIGVWGVSAGGYLSACLGTMAGVKEYEGDGGYPGVSSAVQTVVVYFGPADFTNPAINSSEVTKMNEKLFGVPLDQNPALWKNASPLYHVKAGDPPMILVHGDSDILVPVAQSIIFDQALTKAGVPHQLLIVKNAGHNFNPLPGTTIDPTLAGIQKAVDVFLAKYLKPPLTGNAGGSK